MGFSVSGSAAIVFIGLLIALGSWHTATSNSFERVAEAEDDRADAAIVERNTQVEITAASYDSGAAELTIRVNNTGASQLRLSTSDLLVDGTYVTGWRGGATVAGNGGTDLWLSGEQVEVVLDRTTQPDRVKVVTGPGVAATAGVTTP
jgi:flagellar protein FlaF